MPSVSAQHPQRPQPLRLANFLTRSVAVPPWHRTTCQGLIARFAEVFNPAYAMLKPPRYSVDRVKLWFDHAEYPGSLADLRARCGNAVMVAGQMPYSPRWKSMVDLFQPRKSALRLLQQALGASVAALPVYIELALDVVPTVCECDAVRRIEDAVLATIAPRHHREEARCDQGPIYFERRAKADGQARENVLVCYSDRPSKFPETQGESLEANCIHLEWRITGETAMLRHGLISLDEILALEHREFWARNLGLYALPNKTGVGRVLAGIANANVDASGTFLRRRANTWMEKASMECPDGNRRFVLHNALRGQDKLPWRPYLVSFDRWYAALGRAAVG